LSATAAKEVSDIRAISLQLSALNSISLYFVRALNGDKLNNWDQDVLNHLFEKRVLLLHQRWNAMSHLWGLDQAWMEERGGLLTQEEQQAHDSPAIIHFAGGGMAKPWNHYCTNPWKDRYRQYLAQSPWAQVPMDDVPKEIRSSLVQRALTKASRAIRRTD
jgi:lipopolysaccharide biosynthesis glycosyltransferase